MARTDAGTPDWCSLLRSVRAVEPAVAKLRDMSFFEYLNTVASSPTAGC